LRNISGYPNPLAPTTISGWSLINSTGGNRAMTENLDDPITPIEIVEELTEDEQADLHRLEMKVERAFVESGNALREIRDRRLYRSKHKTFEEYCQDRFGFQRRHPYRLIRLLA